MSFGRSTGFLTLCLAFLFCGLIGCTPKSSLPSAGPAGPSKTEVIVDDVTKEDVQLYLYVDGRTEAYKFVDITARVSGYLEQLYFRSGSIVKEGAKLALIEQDQYKIALEAAQAELANAEAREALTKANVDRAKQLVESRAMTPEELQERQAAYDMARATVAQAKASIHKAELDLKYTDIRAPIPGKTTKNLVDVGNYISPGSASAKLLSIAQMDPIYVDFFISDRQFADLKERMGFREQYDEATREVGEVTKSGNSNGVSGNGEEKMKQILPALNGNYDMVEKGLIDVSLTTGVDVLSANFSVSGKIVALVDNRITYETGQITLRGEVRNPMLNINGNEDFMIYPGQICRVRIPYENVKNAILIHEEAILTDLDTKYVLVVKKEMFEPKGMMGQPLLDPVTKKPLPPTEEYVVHRRDIKIGKLLDTQQRIVLDGLRAGETYIVKGVQRARIGVAVSPVKLEEYIKQRSLVDEMPVAAEGAKPVEAEPVKDESDDKIGGVPVETTVTENPDQTETPEE